MSGFDKAKDKAQQAKGKVKERLGEATDDEDLEASGKRDQFVGETKETARDLKDKAAGKAEDVKRRFEGGDEGEERDSERL